MTGLSWAWLSTPVGRLSVGCSSAGVARVRYGSPPPAEAAGQLSAAPSRDIPADRVADVFDSAFAETPATLIKFIRYPAGAAGSQGVGAHRDAGVLTLLLAEPGCRPAAPDPRPARAVGKIMGSNPIPVIVPCHRVIASDGLGGYSGGAGVEVKRWLLILEGSLPPTLDWQPMTRPG